MSTSAAIAHFEAISEWAFVAAADVGKGLFARSQLLPGQAIGEYAGPRLPLKMLQPGKGEYVLQIPDDETFIDGNWEHCSYKGKRSLAVYANHSAVPNAKLEHWPISSVDQGFELRDRMWLIATESVPAGGEIRIDYEAGGVSQYWMGAQPPETGWRSVRMKPPRPSDAPATVDHLERIKRGCKLLPVEVYALALCPQKAHVAEIVSASCVNVPVAVSLRRPSATGLGSRGWW